MVYYEAYNPESELYHWGIKGMKWGVRRYQNPDGTLTEAGKRRYGTAENFNNVQKTKADKAASNKAAKEAKAQARRAAAEERAKLAVEKAIKNGNVKQIMRNRSGMTTQQLRDALDRASIVKKIDELNGKKPSVLKRITDRGNSVAGAINAVASVGESVKRVKKAFERTPEQDDEAAFKESAKKAALAKVTKDMMGTDKKDPMSADEARAEYRKAMAQIKTTPEERAKAQAKKEAKEEFKTGVKDIVTANSGNKKAMSIEDVYRRERMRNIKHSDYDARERVESILMHHGIKGQKWGVRRYQNKDGTLTNAGKTRQNKHETSESLSTKERNKYVIDALKRDDGHGDIDLTKLPNTLKKARFNEALSNYKREKSVNPQNASNKELMLAAKDYSKELAGPKAKSKLKVTDYGSTVRNGYWQEIKETWYQPIDEAIYMRLMKRSFG